MTEQDLATYQAVTTRPVQTTVFADFNILVPDVPSGGPALLAALKLLPDINSTASGQGMSASHLVSLANASESVYRKALLGIWGNSSEKVLLSYVCSLLFRQWSLLGSPHSVGKVCSDVSEGPTASFFRVRELLCPSKMLK